MTSFQAVVIGIIQGLTEFIPVSSNAHIKVIPSLLRWKDPGAAFTAVIQWGTWVAAVIYFWKDVVQITRATYIGLTTYKPPVTAEPKKGWLLTRWVRALGDFFRSQTQDAKMGWMIAVGTVPIVVLGVALHKPIHTVFRSLYVIAAAAIVFAFVLMVSEWFVRWRERTLRKQKELAELGWIDALAVGFAQVCALVPGASRSGVTITGALFMGVRREAAARFSFLLGLPAIFGAGLYELYKERKDLLESRDSIVNLLIAIVVSGIVGYASIAFLLHYLKRHSTYLFIIYRFVLGTLLLWLLYTGRLEDKETETSPNQHAKVVLQVPTDQ